MMTSTERTAHTVALIDTVQRAVPFGLTRGDVDRLVAFARVHGTLSLMVEVLRPGAEEMLSGPERDALYDTAQAVQRAVRRFDRQWSGPAPARDRDSDLEAAQQAMTDVQPWAL